MQTKRFASKSIAARYPLPCMETLTWEPSDTGFRVSISIGELEAGQMFIPCLSIPFASPRFSATLEGRSATQDNRHCRWTISPGMPTRPIATKNTSVSTHIDYFQIHNTLREAVIVVEVLSQKIPEEYLLVLALTQNQRTDIDNYLSASEGSPTKLISVPPLSQMVADEALRNRICSPTCIQMLLEREGLLVNGDTLISDCFDSNTDLYGVWPLSIAAASSRGLIGGVESFSDFTTVCFLLNKNIPLVCSIRFESGQLYNAPLDKTQGHLVILAGVDAHSVRVYDPAANSAETVLRTYARKEFDDAWMQNNGIAYVLVPTVENKP